MSRSSLLQLELGVLLIDQSLYRVILVCRVRILGVRIGALGFEQSSFYYTTTNLTFYFFFSKIKCKINNFNELQTTPGAYFQQY
jgi:hypothetical protein